MYTVEKIGGTCMNSFDEVAHGLILDGCSDPYGRVFVVSAFCGITDLLLENKKTGAPGVYYLFAAEDGGLGWSEALDEAHSRMCEIHTGLLENAADQDDADAFLRERIEGARSCLIDLRRLCSYGHFDLSAHMLPVREMLSGLGEAHSAYVAALMLRRMGANARMVDLTGWRDERHPPLEERIVDGMAGVDTGSELAIVTGYAQAAEGLVRLYDRGYSEITFARLAAATGASEAVIHKEYHLSSGDPKIIGPAAVRKIGRTNYDVADQLSNLGMEAIHPQAAKILRQAEISLRVANAFEPDDLGTVIDAEIGGEPRVEIVTGIDVVGIEVFEQDMLGVKGYDASILRALSRHKARIVSKQTNGNTITHFVDASLEAVRRVEAEILEDYPSARIHVQKLAVVSAVGRCLKGTGALVRGLAALDGVGIVPIAVQSLSRGVDIQVVVASDEKVDAIRALHRALVETTEAPAAERADPAATAAEPEIRPAA